MQNTPSLTAKTVALLRAAHQLMEGGTIYPDPLAVSILGEDVDVISGFVREHPEFDRLRLFTAARSRFAEDCIASAVARDVRQVVVLGAGLDTFGLRNPHAGKELRVFEVDRPETQQWKRECLAKANLQIPNWLSLVTVDFEQQPFLERLKGVEFNDDRPTFFTWLGVVPYLSRFLNRQVARCRGRLRLRRTGRRVSAGTPRSLRSHDRQSCSCRRTLAELLRSRRVREEALCDRVR
jgi:methyltransferase (TIGR00027 family)